MRTSQRGRFSAFIAALAVGASVMVAVPSVAQAASEYHKCITVICSWQDSNWEKSMLWTTSNYAYNLETNAGHDNITGVKNTKTVANAQWWEHGKYAGRSFIFGPRGEMSNLTQGNVNLGWLENWNDRIDSFK
jgi:hypothetical protein